MSNYMRMGYRQGRALWVALALSALFACSGVRAETVEGVELPPNVELGGKTLVLNGAGVRRLIVKIYVAALYVPKKNRDGEAILHSGEAWRLQIHMLRDVSAEQLAASIDRSLEQTLTSAELAPLTTQLEQLNAALRSLPPMRKGSQILIDYLPERGTALALDGQERGLMRGAEFGSAMLRIWLGSHPRDPGLRDALLGLRG
jgi:hypothetical protein